MTCIASLFPPASAAIAMSAVVRRSAALHAPGKRQQGDIAGALDGHAQPALVTRARAGHAPRENLAALLHERSERLRAFVVDEVGLLDAELAHFLLAEKLALAFARAAPRTFAARAAAALLRPWLARCGPLFLLHGSLFVCHLCSLSSPTIRRQLAGTAFSPLPPPP